MGSAAPRNGRTQTVGGYLSVLQQTSTDLANRQNFVTSGLASQSVNESALSEQLNIYNKAIQNGDYVENDSGWTLLGEGSAEFGNVNIRGSINALSGTIGYWNISTPIVSRVFGTQTLLGTFLESSGIGTNDESKVTGSYVSLYKSMVPESKNITLKSRTTNIATVTVENHSYIVGNEIIVSMDNDSTFSNGGIRVTITAVTNNTFSYSNSGSDSAEAVGIGSVILYDPDIAGLYLRDYSKKEFDYGYFSNTGVAYVSAEDINVIENPSFEYVDSGSVRQPSTTSWSAGTGLTLAALNFSTQTTPAYKSSTTHGAKLSWSTAAVSTFLSSNIDYTSGNSFGIFGLGNKSLFFGFTAFPYYTITSSASQYATISGIETYKDANNGCYLKVTVPATHSFAAGTTVFIDCTAGIFDPEYGEVTVSHVPHPVNNDSVDGYTYVVAKTPAPDATTFYVHLDTNESAFTSGVPLLTSPNISANGTSRPARVYKTFESAIDLSSIRIRYPNGSTNTLYSVLSVETTAAWNLLSDKYLISDANTSMLGILNNSVSALGFPLENILIDSKKIDDAYKAADPTSYASKSNIFLDIPGWLVSNINLVPNPNFGNNIIGWQGGSNGTISRSTKDVDPFYSGAYSLKLYNTGAAAGQLYYADSSPIKMKATAAQSYTASVYVRTEVYTVNSAINIDWYTDSGSNGSSPGTVTSVNSTSWTKVTVTGTAPAGTTAAVITIYSTKAGSGGENTFFDSFKFTPNSKLVDLYGIGYILDNVYLSTAPKFFYGSGLSTDRWYANTYLPDQASIQGTKPWISVDLDSQSAYLDYFNKVGFSYNTFSQDLVSRPSIGVYDSSETYLDVSNRNYEVLTTTSGRYQKVSSTTNIDSSLKLFTGDSFSGFELSAISRDIVTSTAEHSINRGAVISALYDDNSYASSINIGSDKFVWTDETSDASTLYSPLYSKVIFTSTLASFSIPIATTTVSTNTIRITTSTGVTTTTSTGHGLQIGNSNSGSLNLRMDTNEIQTFTANTASTLFLNRFGGNVNIGNAASTITVLGDLKVNGAAAYDGGVSYAGTGTYARLRATSIDGVGSGTQGFQLGATNGLNLQMDRNSIQAYNNSVVAALDINKSGGTVTIGNSTSDLVISKFTVAGYVTNAADGTLGTTTTIPKSVVGLSNVDNTTDANKPVSTATQTALNLKIDSANAVSITSSYFAGHHPEGRIMYNAYLTNDMANARLRGSTVSATQNGSPYTISNANWDAMFDGTASFFAISPTSGFTFPLVLTISLPRTLTYGASVGIGFGNLGWRANSVQIEVFSLDSNSWVSVINTTTNTSEDVSTVISGLTNSNATGINQIRYTLSNPNSSQFRIAHLWAYNFNSDMWSQAMMPRAGGAFYGDVTVPSLAVGPTLAGNANIEIGRTNGVSSTPFIDFHSGATNVDYDSRIIASGGNGTTGQGTLTFTAATNAFTGTVTGITKAMVGLGNVDNTSDANKPISTAEQTALDLKANVTSPTFSSTVVIDKTTYGFSVIAAAPANTTYWKIATLPITSSGTYDHVVIDAILDDNWGSNQKVNAKILFSNRNGFTYRYYLNGTVRSNSRILAHTETNGSVSIYLRAGTSTYCSFSYNITHGIDNGTVVYKNPTSTTTTPTGTLAFDSGNIATYVPQMYVPYTGTPQIQGNSLAYLANITATAVGLGNVTNESKATMFTSPVFTGNVPSVTSSTATSIKKDTDLVNRAYVDSQIINLTWRLSVVCATTGALGTSNNLVGGTITTTYSPGTLGAGATLTIATSTNWTAITIDNYSFAVGDRILIKNQDNAAYNGIYTATTKGTVGTTTSFVFTRATDSDLASENFSRYAVYVENGSVSSDYADRAFTNIIDGDVVMGTTPLTFTLATGLSNAIVPVTGTGRIPYTNSSRGLTYTIPTSNTGQVLKSGFAAPGANLGWYDPYPFDMKTGKIASTDWATDSPPVGEAVVTFAVAFPTGVVPSITLSPLSVGDDLIIVTLKEAPTNTGFTVVARRLLASATVTTAGSQTARTGADLISTANPTTYWTAVQGARIVGTPSGTNDGRTDYGTVG